MKPSQGCETFIFCHLLLGGQHQSVDIGTTAFLLDAPGAEVLPKGVSKVTLLRFYPIDKTQCSKNTWMADLSVGYLMVEPSSAYAVSTCAIMLIAKLTNLQEPEGGISRWGTLTAGETLILLLVCQCLHWRQTKADGS